MKRSDKLNISSHILNFSIVLYILITAFKTNSFQLSHPLLALTGLIIAVLVNIIAVLDVLK